LRCVKNIVLDVAFRSSGGRAFQAAGPATANAPSAIIVLVVTTAKFPRWVERSRRRRRRGTVLSGRMVLCAMENVVHQ